MARRHHHETNPVAARQRKVFAQGLGLTLLFAAAVFLVFMAVTAY